MRPLLRSRRRAFLGALAGAAACRPSATPRAPAAAPTPVPGPSPTPEGVTAEVIAAAEKLASVEYSAAERQQIVESLEAQLEAAKLLASLEQPGELAPATVFDPRPSGYRIRTGSSRVKSAGSSERLPKKDEDIAFAPVQDLSRFLRRREITSVRLTELYLQRLANIGKRLQCVVTITKDLAFAQAERADEEIKRGRLRGQLHGVPWGAKDLFDAKGTPTTWGATPYRARVADADATVVARLTEAGAVLVAKLTTGALAYGDIWFDGRTRNPWNEAEGSSGSSAGPACAVAAGLVGFALGTETLGSIVSPSMRCGTVGLRPTFGRVPRTGCMALCWSLDKIGPITRTVDDAAVVLGAIAGPDDRDASARAAPLTYDGRKKLDRLRVGHVPAWFKGDGANDVDRAALEAVRKLPVELVGIEFPQLPAGALIPVLYAEAATAFAQLTRSDRDDELVWQGDEAWPNAFRRARFITAIDYLTAQRLRREFVESFAKAFADVDALIGPSFAGGMLTATNFTGHPSLTIRAGFTEASARPWLDNKEIKDEAAKRVPHGVTLWGRLYDEGTLCRLGAAVEAELGIWSERPPSG